MQIGNVVSAVSPFDRGKRWRRGAASAALGSRPDARTRAPVTGPASLAEMTGDELERGLSSFFGRRGYTVWPTAARGEVAPTLLLCRGDQGVVVQVKRWNAALGPEVVRAVIEAVRHHADTLKRLGCSRVGGLVVSTSSFKPDAVELAASSGVLLWDREALETQLRGDADVPERADPASGEPARR